MATSAPRTTAAKRLAAKNAPQLPEIHTPGQAAAHALILEYRDLEPSINRIMAATLTDDGKLHAIALFQASLTSPGDPNRTPAHAIEAARALHGDGPAPLDD